jgi:hypothetical protein
MMGGGGCGGLGFPQCGKKFSTLWKNIANVFHAVEKTSQRFPHYGKKFSTLWKTAAAGLLLALPAGAEAQNATIHGLTPFVGRLGIWCEFMPYAEVERHLPVLATYDCDLILYVERESLSDPDFPALLRAAERAGVGVDAWLLLPYEEHLYVGQASVAATRELARQAADFSRNTI